MKTRKQIKNGGLKEEEKKRRQETGGEIYLFGGDWVYRV